MSGLTVEQLEFLAAKGLSLEDAITFAKMGEKPKSKGAERTARWRANKGGNVTETVTSDVTGDASPPPIDNNHTPPVSSNEETRARPKKSKSVMPAKPDEVSEQVWQDFTELRRKKGGLTPTALGGIRAEAEAAGWPLERALAECVTRNWQGFKAEWVRSSNTVPAKPQDGGSYLDFVVQKQQRQGAQA